MYSIHEQGLKTVYQDGIEDVEISAPGEQCLGLIGFEEPPAGSWPEDFRSALGSPIKTAPLHDIARGARRVAVIVSDSTRGVPTAKVMPMILDELTSAGVRKGDITIVVATGVHRNATEDEIREIVGKEYLSGLNVISHDPYDADNLVSLGKTSFGTPVEVSRTVFEAGHPLAKMDNVVLSPHLGALSREAGDRPSAHSAIRRIRPGGPSRPRQ